MADNRALRYSLVASVALHGMLFLPLAPRHEFTPPSPPIVVRLVAPVTKANPGLRPLHRTVAKPAPPPAASREVPEAVSRDQYRIELMSEAVRHARERYPQLARENKWEGDVHVGIVVSASGRTTLTLKGSSGHEVLDEQALELLRQAAQAVAPPAALRGRDFAIEVRASYRLAD